MDELQQLQEQRQKLAAKLRASADVFNATEFNGRAKEAQTWPDDEQRTKFEKISSDYNAVEAKLTEARNAQQVADAMQGLDSYEDNPVASGHVGRDDASSRQSDQPSDTEVEERHVALSLDAWTRRGRALPLTDEHRDALRRTGLNPNSRDVELQLQKRSDGTPCWAVRSVNRFEQRVQNIATAGKGQETVFDGFIPTLEKALLAYGGPRAVSNVLRTPQGNTLLMAKYDDTANKGAIVAESGAITADTDIAFTQISLGAYKYKSGEILVTYELDRDSYFDIPSIVGEGLGERIGRATAEHFTTGNGTSQPEGIVTGASAGITTAAAAAIVSDELFDLIHSLDPAYRSQGAGWMFHDQVLLALRKLKDSSGNYLWQEGLSVMEPDRLLGYPYSINQEMESTIATGNVTALFGLFNKFLIRDVASFRLRRLTELHALNDQVGYIAFSDHDSKVIQPNAIKKLTQA